MERTPTNKYLWTYRPIGAKELLGEEGSERKAISLCQKLHWQDCVLISSRLLTILQHQGIDSRETQTRLAGYIYGDQAEQQIRHILAEKTDRFRNTLFSDWQLLTCIKLALLYGGDDHKLTLGPKSGFNKIGTWFLTVNDLATIFPTEELIKAGDATLNSWIVHSALMRTDSLRALQARYFDLLLILPNQDALRQSPNFVDIRSLFEKALKMDLETFMAAGYGIFTNFVNAERLDIREYIISGRAWFKHTLLPRETSEAVFRLVSISREAFKKQHATKYREGAVGKYYDFTCFRKRPLIEFEADSYIPVGIRYLLERFTVGIYWDICDSLTGRDKTKFMTFFGQIVQSYVEKLFRRVYPGSSILATRAHYDRAYGKGGGQRASDIILFYGHAAVFIEVISGGLRMEDTITTGNTDAFWQDMQKVIDASRQLDRVIKDFSSGNLLIPGWSSEQIRQYYPVVITATPLPLFFHLYDDLRKKVADCGYLKSAGIENLEVISLTELEMLEPFLSKGQTLIELLRKKASTELFSRLPMQDFMHSLYDEKELSKDNPYLEELRYEFHTRSMKVLFGGEQT